MEFSPQASEPELLMPGMVLKVVRTKNAEDCLQTFGLPDDDKWMPTLHRGTERLLVLTAPEVIKGNTVIAGQTRIRAALMYVTVVRVRGEAEAMKVADRVELLQVQGNLLKRQAIPRIVDTGKTVSASEILKIRQQFNL